MQDPTSRDTSRAKFLAWINSNYTILGIPLFGNDVSLSSVQFDVPTEASIAKVCFGSLGVGGDPFSPEAIDGAVLTLIFKIGIPSVLLTAGIAMSPTIFKALGETSTSVVEFMQGQLPYIIASAFTDAALRSASAPASRGIPISRVARGLSSGGRAPRAS